MTFNRTNGDVHIKGILDSEDLAERVARCEERGYRIVARKPEQVVTAYYTKRGLYQAQREKMMETVVLRKIKEETNQ